MRTLLILLATFGVLASSHAGDEVTGRIVKVLPFLIDQKGHNAISPSLFDRDAYQVHLREHTNEVSGMRFDVLWKADKSVDEQIKIAVELRGTGTNGVPATPVLQTNVVPGTFRHWTSIPLAGEDYKQVGQVIAWRVTLWNGDQKLDEEKSFLWKN